MSTFRYPYSLTCDEAGYWLVRFKDLSGAAADGRTRDEALVEAEDCLAEAVAGYLVRRQYIPRPGSAGDGFISLDPKHQSHIRAVLQAAALLGVRAEVRFEYPA